MTDLQLDSKTRSWRGSYKCQRCQEVNRALSGVLLEEGRRCAYTTTHTLDQLEPEEPGGIKEGCWVPYSEAYFARQWRKEVRREEKRDRGQSWFKLARFGFDTRLATHQPDDLEEVT